MAAACLASLACASSIEARPSARSATFKVTLSAQITKTWNYVTTRQVGDCTVTDRVRGSRTVTLASGRPTTVKVISANGRIRFSPSIVRSVTARATQSGSVASTERGLNCSRSTRRACGKPRRTLSNQTLQFFRSGRNAISFRQTRDYGGGFSPQCPPEALEVRVERPGIHQAQGQLSEQDLFNRGVRSQTASGSIEETTELSGDPDGEVVEKVSWSLTFRHT